MVPELIATSKATYDPERDSDQSATLQLQQEAISRRQSTAKTVVSNLLTFIQKLTIERNSVNLQLD